MTVTTSTEYGRAKILVPDFQHEPGNTLHSKLVGTYGDKYGFETISDYLNSVWYNISALPDTSTQNIVHNFNLSYTSNELLVMIWIGGARQTKAQITTNFVIAQVDTNTISIQNVSGGPLTFQVMVMSFQVANYLQKILQVFPGAGFGIDTEEGGILEIGHTLATDLNLGRSSQYQELKGRASLVVASNGTATGTATTVGLPATSFLRLTNASLISVAGITAPVHDMLLIVTNATGGTVNFLGEDTAATAADRFGMDTPIAVANKATLFLAYDTTSSRWRVAGGAGGGAYTVKALQTISASGTITLGSEGFQTIRVAGNAAPVTASSTPFGATPPPDGTVITLIGNNSANSVTIVHNDAANGCWLNGNCELARGTSLTVQYISAVSRYVEHSRNSILGL